MVLRCSLLGHDYGDTEVEREREERGSEVVISVEEYEECARCGERNVISENTEVTSIPLEARETTNADPDSEPNPDRTPTEPAAGSSTDAAVADTDRRDQLPETDGETPSRDEGHAATGNAEAQADPDTLESAPDHPTDEDGEPITDDAEILEDDPEDESSAADRERGAWPESDDVGPPVGAENEPSEWPESEGEGDADDVTDDGDGGADTDPDLEPDSEIIDSDDQDPESEPDLQFDDPATDVDPETDAVTSTEPTDDAVFVDADSATERDTRGAEPASDGTDSETGITSAQSAPAPGDGALSEDVPTEFYCPRCSYVAAGDRGSLRAGDICPECRKGYLGERERQR